MKEHADFQTRQGKCQHECPGGNPCCCYGHVPHTLHICSSSSCICHSRATYEEAKQQRAAVRKALQTAAGSLRGELENMEVYRWE